MDETVRRVQRAKIIIYLNESVKNRIFFKKCNGEKDLSNVNKE